MRVTVSLTLPVSSTSRRPGARVVANSTAPSRFRLRPAKPEVVEHREVLEQRRLDVDRQRADLAAAGGDRDLAFLVRQRRQVEQPRDGLPLLDLDQQHPPALGGQRQGQRRGDRGLAGAALAGDDVQPGPPAGGGPRGGLGLRGGGVVDFGRSVHRGVRRGDGAQVLLPAGTAASVMIVSSTSALSPGSGRRCSTCRWRGGRSTARRSRSGVAEGGEVDHHLLVQRRVAHLAPVGRSGHVHGDPDVVAQPAGERVVRRHPAAAGEGQLHQLAGAEDVVRA